MHDPTGEPSGAEGEKVLRRPSRERRHLPTRTVLRRASDASPRPRRRRGGPDAGGGCAPDLRPTGPSPRRPRFVSLQNTYYAKFKTWGEPGFPRCFPACCAPGSSTALDRARRCCGSARLVSLRSPTPGLPTAAEPTGEPNPFARAPQCSPTLSPVHPSAPPVSWPAPTMRQRPGSPLRDPSRRAFLHPCRTPPGPTIQPCQATRWSAGRPGARPGSSRSRTTSPTAQAFRSPRLDRPPRAPRHPGPSPARGPAWPKEPSAIRRQHP